MNFAPKVSFFSDFRCRKKNDFLNIEVGFTVVYRHTFSSSVCEIGSQELLNCVFLTKKESFKKINVIYT